MHRDLEKSYIPLCADCLHNKSNTRKPIRPLHPSSILDDQGNRVALDFIGPLPLNDSFNCVLSMTDWLGSDIWIVLTWVDLNAEELALLFFNHWYCENSLPKEIISDHDKLFVSKFWTALHRLTGVKLKLSSAYHPETDGSSKWSNKTINQCIFFHIHRNQKGWVCALPHIHFDIMNMVNAPTGFSNFQIWLGRSPCLIPPLIPNTPVLPQIVDDDTVWAQIVIECIQTNFANAKDNLLQAKITQAYHTNDHWSLDPPFKVGNKVMLFTLHCHQEFKKKGEKRVAKFFHVMMVHTMNMQLHRTIPSSYWITQIPIQHFTLLNSKHFSQITPIFFLVTKWHNLNQS